MMNICQQCGGAIMTPGLSYGYAGPVCMCSWRTPVTPMPQAQIDEALVLAIEADKREIERLRTELAASQAREKVRIEALKRAAKTFTDYGRHHMKKAPPDLDKASSNVDLATDMMAAFILPADDTALRAALDQRERETIKRCAVEAHNAVSCSTAAQARIKKLCVDAISALEVKP